MSNQITIAEFKKLSKKNKFGANKAEYKSRLYDSTKERDYAIQLDWLKKTGEIAFWKPQIKIKIEINGIFICYYKVDFEVIFPGGTYSEYHEVKSEGTMTDLWRLKWKLVKALYPNYKFVLIK
jgi:hypothetical protein